MSEDLAGLNYDFNYNMRLAKMHLNKLPNYTDRQKSERWFRKLKDCSRSEDEMKLRNTWAYHLTQYIMKGRLEPPFNENPPSGPLETLSHLLGDVVDGAELGLNLDPSSGLWSADSAKTSSARPMLYRHSPDGGAFLASQPVPKSGAFCYLAVINSSPNDEQDEI